MASCFAICTFGWFYSHSIIILTHSRSGLLPGDVLLNVNSSSFHDFCDISELLSYMKAQVVHFIHCLDVHKSGFWPLYLQPSLSLTFLRIKRDPITSGPFESRWTFMCCSESTQSWVWFCFPARNMLKLLQDIKGMTPIVFVPFTNCLE